MSEWLEGVGPANKRPSGSTESAVTPPVCTCQGWLSPKKTQRGHSNPPPPPPPHTPPKSEAGQGSTSPTHQSLSDEEGGRETQSAGHGLRRITAFIQDRGVARGELERNSRRLYFLISSKSHDFTCDYSVGNWRGASSRVPARLPVGWLINVNASPHLSRQREAKWRSGKREDIRAGSETTSP